MAASSSKKVCYASSSSPPPQDYDVFISFRGEDTRNNFTDHLQSALRRSGFFPFIDYKLERGEGIGPELLKAIERSRVSVIVLSRNYAHSRWCLDELVKIMECRSTYELFVLPVFYDVDPSDVRKQQGSFAEAFARHGERYKGTDMNGKVEAWRAALTEVADLAGRHWQNDANGRESILIDMIVEDILKKLNPQYLNVAQYPIGIEYRVQRVNELLELGSGGVRMVGIWGIGGIGKTTIVKAIYNQSRHQFEGSSFLADVREISKQPDGLVRLQEQLLSNILLNENKKIKNVDQGIEVIKKRLRHRRVFVVLDDVDEFEQLRSLAIRRDWFHSGSRIIVTCRDESILKFLEVDGQYEPEFLAHDESLQLFSWHVFSQDHPKEDYVKLSREVVACAQGLPLVLEVWGSLFKCTSGLAEWKSTLERLKEIPLEKVQERLKISYDSLEDEEKKLFLDIACFFVGMETDYAMTILKACHRFLESGLGVLSRRSLINPLEDTVMMHDMIRDMGRDVARKEYLKVPEKCSRLWCHDDVLDVLANDRGTEAVEGLHLNLHRSTDLQVNAQAFAKMKRLRLLKLNYVRLCGSYKHLPKRLIWLCWYGFPLKLTPPNLLSENTVVIDMCYSSLKQVWKGKKNLSNLKILDLSHSYHLTETPDFSRVTSLEKLLLNDCTRLVEVHQSVECLEKLLVLNMSNCNNLRKLPLGIWKLTSLEDLSLSGCSKLEHLPGFEGSPSKSRFSLISSRASRMKNLVITSHSPTSISGLIFIRELNLDRCNLSYIPDELGSLTSLGRLCLRGNNFRTLPASISHLSNLWNLDLSGCIKLQSIPELPVRVTNVAARYCTSLERISIRSDFLAHWSLPGCYKLVENNIGSNVGQSLLEKQVLFPGLRGFQNRLLFPGGEIPPCFKYQSVGSVLSFVAPHGNIRGCIICLVLAGGFPHKILDWESGDWKFGGCSPIWCEVRNKTRRIRSFCTLASVECLHHRQDHLIVYNRPYFLTGLQAEDGDEVEFLFFDKWEFSLTTPSNYDDVRCRGPFLVKKCGVILTYVEDVYIKNYLAARASSGMPPRFDHTIKYHDDSPWYRDPEAHALKSAIGTLLDEPMIQHASPWSKSCM